MNLVSDSIMLILCLMDEQIYATVMPSHNFNSNLFFILLKYLIVLITIMIILDKLKGKVKDFLGEIFYFNFVCTYIRTDSVSDVHVFCLKLFLSR